MTISTTTKHHRVYPTLDYTGKSETTLNIRIASKANRNKTIDIPVYKANGSRVKVLVKSFKDGMISKGYYSAEETAAINDLIEEIHRKVKLYCNQYPEGVTKQLVENFVYGPEFIQEFKNKKVKEIQLTTYKTTYTETYKQWRTKYPKRKEVVYKSSIDENGFEVETAEETVIDPLDINAFDFPARFPVELYNKLKDEYLTTVAKSEQEVSTFFINAYVKYRATILFHDTPAVTEIHTIDPKALRKFKEETGESIPLNVNNIGNYTITESTEGLDKTVKKVTGIKEKLLEYNKKYVISNNSPQENFEKGLWDKSNIFHLFASVKYINKLKSDSNEKVIIRMLDYMVNAKPETNVKHFNRDWILKFFKWMEKNGYAKTVKREYNPFTIDKSFFKPERTKHLNGTLNNNIIAFKQIAKHLTKLNLLPEGIDYTLVNLEDVREGATVEAGKKSNHRLTLTEYEKIQNLTFNRTSKDYVSMLDDLHSKGILKANKTYKKITVADIERYRGVFCLSVWIGGLRGLAEYNSVKILDYDKEQIFRIYQNKTQMHKETKKYVDNPHNKYTRILLKRNKNKLPIIHENENKTYNAVLKLIGHLAKLDREFEPDTAIKNELSMYWHRKSFINILTSKRVEDQDIELFTGHAGKGAMKRNYKDFQNIELKREILKEKGLLK